MADLYDQVQELQKKVEELERKNSDQSWRSRMADFFNGFTDIFRIKSGYIQSSDYKAGERGWKLSPNVLEANNGTFRGDVTGSTFTGVELVGSTVTGGVVRTSDGPDRIEIDGEAGTLTVYVGGVERLIIGTATQVFNSPMGAFSGSLQGFAPQDLVISANPGEGGGLITLQADNIAIDGAIPTSDPSEPGRLWRDGTDLKISV